MATPFERALLLLLLAVTILATLAVLGLRARIADLTSQLEHQRIVMDALGAANEELVEENEKLGKMIDDGVLPRALPNGEYVRL